MICQVVSGQSPVSRRVFSVNLSISVRRCAVSKSTQTTSDSTGSHSKLSGLDTLDQGDAVKLEGREFSAV